MRVQAALRFLGALGVVAVASLVAAAAVAGCRATPAPASDDLSMVDMSVVGDDLAEGDDLAVAADLAMCPVGPEVCGNGCDDDRNGYTDDDDPACTSQMLVTLAMGSATQTLQRLILEPKPHLVVVDGNPIVSNGAMATYNRAFAPAAFVAYDGSTKILERRPIGGGTIGSTSTGYQTRDVCVFNGELIVVDARPSAPGYLHRFMADGKTEIDPTTPPALPKISVPIIPSACSSDGDFLYVAGHPQFGDGEIVVYGKSANGPVATGATIALPDDLLNAGYNRLVDLVYLKKTGGFIGLFAMDSGTGDNNLNGDVMAPFGFDGGVGAFIDGGVWHGAGEFMP